MKAGYQDIRGRRYKNVRTWMKGCKDTTTRGCKDKRTERWEESLVMQINVKCDVTFDQG